MFTSFFLQKRTCHWRHYIVLHFSLVYHATLKFLIFINLLFLDLDNTYITGLCYPGSQHFFIYKFLCSFIISLYCHISYSVFQAFSILPQPLFCLLICILHTFLFTVFKLPLTRGQFDLFYRFQISLGQVIHQSVA